MRALGIDPGTSRWAFAFLEGGELADEAVVATDEIKSSPGIALSFAKHADVVVAPSGYGSTLKRVSELGPDDYAEILLKRDCKQIMGLEKVLRLMSGEGVNAYVIPGVKLLPAVPENKKHNKIDMGTPDKLCAAVAGIVNQSRRLNIPYNETSFILAEIGFGFDAFVAVENGQIRDGIGGTMASSTWRGEDGELLYLKGELSKEELKKDCLSLEKVAKGALKDIRSLSEGFIPREILVSGSASGNVLDFLRQGLNNVVSLRSCKSSNAAYGAAIIADGLAGGRFKELVELLEIMEASGSNLDYVNI